MKITRLPDDTNIWVHYRNNAIKQTEKCPFCDNGDGFNLLEYPIKKYVHSKKKILKLLNASKEIFKKYKIEKIDFFSYPCDYYRCSCKKCGAKWETDMFIDEDYVILKDKEY